MQLFDLGPTILEWAGAEINETFEAISLNPALYGYAFDGRNFVFCEQAGDVNMTGTSFLTMVRSKTHKLIQFRGEEEGQLFDLFGFNRALPLISGYVLMTQQSLLGWISYHKLLLPLRITGQVAVMYTTCPIGQGRVVLVSSCFARQTTQVIVHAWERRTRA